MDEFHYLIHERSRCFSAAISFTIGLVALTGLALALWA
jgi:hypothetical protein